MVEPLIIQKILLTISLLFIALLFAKVFIDGASTRDGVNKEAESLYLDRDILGQPKDWINPKKNSDKNELPILSSPNIPIIIGVVLIIRILIYFRIS